MRKPNSIFLFSVTLLALFVSITGVLAKLDFSARLFQILFVPVTFYLCVSLFSHLLKGVPALERKNGWERVLTYYCFVVTSTTVVVSFLSSNTLSELISSAIFSPLAVYFLLLILPRGVPAIEFPTISKSDTSGSYKETTVLPPPRLDVNRRDFLKLIGTAGALSFIFSLFTRRAAIPFFAGISDAGTITLKDSGGNKVNPREKLPTDGYYISEVDDATDTSYFGFINKDSQWYIMREDSDGSFLYVRGGSQFSSSWADRENLTYDRFDKVFSY